MNKKIQTIFKQDQKDRHDKAILADKKLFIKRDKERKFLVVEMIKSKQLNSGLDFYMAAMIFHHGPTIQDSKKAISLIKTSVDLGYKKALRFYATAIDRLLIRQGKKQKFGTQYYKKNDNEPWKISPYDLKTTDEERFQYNLLSLAEMKNNIDRLNLHS